MMEPESTGYPFQMKIHYFSEVGPKRKINQDNYYVCGSTNLYSKPHMADSEYADTQTLQAIALFDGMGGESSGERASLVAAETMNQFIRALGGVLHEEAIFQASCAYYANFMEIIADYLGDDTSVCGTTFVGVFLQHQYLIPVWLGDSRAYLLRGGTLHRITTDHSLAQLKIQQGIVSEEDAKGTHDWHVLTGYMGQFNAEFSIGTPVALRSGDKIFLCSDGITDQYTDDELLKILSVNAKHSMQTLLKMAQTEAEDNCTAILIDIANNPLCSLPKIFSRRFSQWRHTFEWKTRK